MTRSIRRRLIMFLDGTWNVDDGSHPPTNVVRLREALKIGVEAIETQAALPKASGFAHGTVGEQPASTFEYVVHYDRGVGTGALDHLTGGIMGDGLEDNIREAYRFLSRHFREGDEIHLIGFSRGAYTARSIVGYLFATGLLKPEHCTTEREAQAWRHYRTSPGNRNCGDWYALKPYLHPTDTVLVKTVGVFDTVGALGIPATPFQKLNELRYAFHNTELSSIVENSFHAVAIDEHRNAFEATLWHTPKFKKYPGARIEQVWFPGAHADIGGGYQQWDDRERGRQDIAFAWMLGRLRDVSNLPLGSLGADATAPALDCAAEEQVEAPIHRPWGRLDRFRSQACRAINQTRPRESDGIPVKGRGTKTVGLKPHEEPIGEMVHVSGLELLASAAGVAWEGIETAYPYRSPNLVAVLPLIAFTYKAWDDAAWRAWKPYADALPRMAAEPRTVSVVDWTGTVMPTQPPPAGASEQGRTVFDYLGADPSRFGFKP